MTRADQETTAGGARTQVQTSGADDDGWSTGDVHTAVTLGGDRSGTDAGAAGLSQTCAQTAQAWTGLAGSVPAWHARCSPDTAVWAPSSPTATTSRSGMRQECRVLLMTTHGTAIPAKRN